MQISQATVDEMVATRRALHRIPEEGWTEFETTSLIAEKLSKLGYEVLTGKRIIDPANAMGRNPEKVAAAIKRAVANGVSPEFIASCDEFTGCAAILDTGRPGPVTAMRFDIDCVCVQETSDPEHVPNKLGFASTRPGLMHACGHDGHTAVGLATAKVLMENRDRLCGKIKLVFQPAEEGVRGAAAVAASGFLDDCDLIIGSHCGGKAGPGEIALVHSGVLASTKFDIRFTGTPSHAGNMPHKGHSALMAACATAMMMVGIPRHGDGATRVAVGKLNAGEGRNVTPVHATIECEVRGETAEINDYMCEAVRDIVNGNTVAYRVKSEIEKVGEATTLVECPEVLEILNEVAQGIPQVKAIRRFTAPSGSEDFTMMLRRVVQKGGRGAMFRWGCRHNGHHKADFDLQDTESMPLALAMFTGFALKTNGIK